ncbi:MAG: redoxin domain-containing protein [Candidatus Sumerlaeaceae bacterium]|nr:redoxin domain-containing protein [Candidatus Sumerlaeaceae bacterium]
MIMGRKMVQKTVVLVLALSFGLAPAFAQPPNGGGGGGQGKPPGGKGQQGGGQQQQKMQQEQQKRRQQMQQQRQKAQQQFSQQRKTIARPTSFPTAFGGDAGTTRVPVMTNDPMTSTSAVAGATTATKPAAKVVEKRDPSIDYNVPGVMADGPMPQAATAEVRELLQNLSPDERAKVMQYVQGLTVEERQGLRTTMGVVNPDERRTKLLAMVQKGEKPVAASTDMQRLEQELKSDLGPALVVKAANPTKSKFSSKAVAASAVLPQIGTLAPDFSLETLEGRPISLSSFRGKPLVVEFGSVTCPVYRGHIEEMAELKSRHKDKANFLLVYTLEAHPSGSASPYSDHEWIPRKNQTDGILRMQTSTTVQRKELADELVRRHGEKMTIAIDTMDNKTWQAYGARANSAFVIDADGRIVAAQEWANPAGLATALAGPDAGRAATVTDAKPR